MQILFKTVLMYVNFPFTKPLKSIANITKRIKARPTGRRSRPSTVLLWWVSTQCITSFILSDGLSVTRDLVFYVNYTAYVLM